MTMAPRLLVIDGDPEAMAAAVLRLGRGCGLLALAAPQEAEAMRQALTAAPLPEGPALVLGTGGSSGGRRWCLQPLEQLQASAEACGQWLAGLGIDPTHTQLFNPLPLHHVSGVMPLLRSARWGADHRWLAPALMREPARLLAEAAPGGDRPALLSLVPTQLQRLMADSDGQRWLASFALIWVGGAALPVELAVRCRRQAVRLSPCYGSTETAAMVAALAPEDFLAGVEGCGFALPHARLRIGAERALEIHATSLAAGFLAAGRFDPLPLAQGWWRSGDAASLTPQGLQWCGRLDGAISSGGETVFPEQVHGRLLELATAGGLPLEALLLLAEPDPLWGERLVALVRPGPGLSAEDPRAGLLARLEALAQGLPPAQRPCRWLLCPELKVNAAGKWDQAHWRSWLAAHKAAGR